MKTAKILFDSINMANQSDSGWIAAPFDSSAFDDISIAVSWSDATGTLDGSLTVLIAIDNIYDVLDSFDINLANGKLFISSKLLANKYKIIYTPNNITGGTISAEFIYSLKV